MNKLTLLLSLLIIASCAQNSGRPQRETVKRVDGDMSEDAAEFIEYCKTAACRQNTHFRVKLEDASYYEYNGELDPPVIQSGLITLYPGESIHVEAEIAGDALVNLNLVQEIANPDRTITFKFWQEPSTSKGTGMMLSVHNPFDRYLRYELGIMKFDSTEVQYSSSCPVLPGRFAYEHWPYPLFQLAMTNLRLVDIDNEQISCE